MFSLVLTFKRYEDAMIFCVFIFIFCLEPTEREQLDENDFRHYYGNFSEAPFWKYLITAMFKVLSKQLRGTLTTAFERHMTIKNFTDMDHHRCQLFFDLTSLNENRQKDLKNIHLHENLSLLMKEHWFKTFHLLLCASFLLK